MCYIALFWLYIMLFSCFTRFLGSYITFFLLNSMLNIMLYSEGGIYYSYLSCYVCAYIVKVVCTALFIMACNMLYWIFHLYWIFRRFNTLYNLLYSTNTDQAPSGITAPLRLAFTGKLQTRTCTPGPSQYRACNAEAWAIPPGICTRQPEPE